jgi:hypothetical protein
MLLSLMVLWLPALVRCLLHCGAVAFGRGPLQVLQLLCVRVARDYHHWRCSGLVHVAHCMLLSR